MRLKDRVAIVTGAARGIGQTYCLALAREGAKVVAADVLSCAATVDKVQEAGGAALGVTVDVANAQSTQAMAAQTVQRFGRIDILVNNAAINRGDNFATTTDRAWDEVINTNVGSLFAVTKPIYKQMIRQRDGKILNITSIGAMRALPTSVHYATSKAAMIGFTKCLAREAGTFGVSVNAIAAGIFDTDLAQALPERLLQLHDFWTSKGRLGRPAEMAEYAAFMCSDRNSFMNGEVVIVDGGAIT